MAFRFNPFTGSLDDVSDVAEKVESIDSSTTTDAVVRWASTDGLQVKNSGVTIDDSDNVIVPGNLTVNGTTTTVNSTDLEVTDNNITLNNNGSDASAEQAGLTVERTGTDGCIKFNNSLSSKWEIGLIGSTIEVADISSAQTLINKTIDADSNTILDIANVNISATAAIDFSKMQMLTADRATTTSPSGVIIASDITLTELNALDNISGNIQTLLDAKLDDSQLIDDDSFATASSTNIPSAESTKAYIDNRQYFISSQSANFTASANETYVVDTSSAITATLPSSPTVNTYIRIKDSTGTANTNNITVNTPGAETIDGQANNTIDSDFESRTYVYDGTQWLVL